jgi:hypothetical protein
MGVVWYWLRADLRVRWRALVLIALLVGVGGGVALTAFAGARRTAAAVPQLLAYSRPDDGAAIFGGGSCPPPAVTGPAAGSLAPLPVAARVLRLPQVAAFMRTPYLFLSASPSGSGTGSVNVTASADVQGYRAIDRPLMVAGRYPDPGRPFDAAVNDLAAQRLHLGVGSRLTLYAYSEKQVLACDLTGATGSLPAPAGPRFTVRVVGIARTPNDINAVAPLAAAQGVDYDGQGQVYLARAFLPRYAAALGIPVQDVSGMNAYFVRVHGGAAGWNAFAASTMRVDRGAILDPGGGDVLQGTAASAERGTHLETVALLLFGGLAAFVTVLLAGQAMTRQVLLEEGDLTILAGLGMSRAQIAAMVVLRAVTAGVAGGVLAVAAALTFGASLDQLVNSPRQQGWNWDVLVGNRNTTSDPAGQIVPRLAGDPLVGSYSALTVLQGGGFTVDGTAVANTFVFDPLKGAVFPPLLDGRPPRAPGEIVLGTSTLRQIGRHVGQTVKLWTPAGATTMRVVGRMIVPSAGDILTNDLGQGAWVPASYFRRFNAEAARLRLASAPPPFYQLFAVRYAPGVPPAQAFTRLRHDFGPTVLRHIPGQNIVNLQSVDGLPLVLAGLAAFLGAVTLGNTMMIFVRRRRRDLAILKTLGFRRRQVAAAVAWQATSFILAALAVGLPLGVAAGRWAWDLAAAQLESAAPPVIPALAIALIVPAALLAGNALAAIPARAAARTAPAISLRQE